MRIEEYTAQELFELLNELDETDSLEAKSLRDDTSRSILETVCSFSNEPGLGGGVILVGVAENKAGDGPQYIVDGVADPDKAQLDLATQCKSVFNTPIYPTIKVEKVDGKAVLKVVVDEQPFGRKPVYFKKDGLPKGAYRRIGSADLVSTEEDLWRFYEDPDSNYDETPVKHSSLADVDERAVQRYRQMRKKVDPTMESDRTAATFTIRLLLCHFFSEETLDWLKRFAAYDLNDNQRTALVFLREVGAIDAIAYRQLTGCSPKLVAKELSGIKDQGLMVQKGRARGTYYVPAEILLEVTTTPPAATTTPNSSSQGLISPPQGHISPPQGLTSQPTPEDMPIPLLERIKTFPRRARDEAALLSIIVDACSWKAQTNESLAQMLHRSPEYIKKFITKHIGKELDYLYPMMVHHPRQAYVASGKGMGTA